MNSLDLAKKAAQIATDKKALRVLILDMQDKADICQHMMICSGTNDRQTRAIADGIQDYMKKNHSVLPLAVEGKSNGHWVLLDYGGTIVHIFYDAVRDYYALEKLWSGAKILRLKDS